MTDKTITIDTKPTPMGFANLATALIDSVISDSARPAVTPDMIEQIVRVAGSLGQDSRDPTITAEARSEAQIALVALVKEAGRRAEDGRTAAAIRPGAEGRKPKRLGQALEGPVDPEAGGIRDIHGDPPPG